MSEHHDGLVKLPHDLGRTPMRYVIDAPEPAAAPLLALPAVLRIAHPGSPGHGPLRRTDR